MGGFFKTGSSPARTSSCQRCLTSSRCPCQPTWRAYPSLTASLAGSHSQWVTGPGFYRLVSLSEGFPSFHSRGSAPPTIGPILQDKLKVLPGFQAARCNNKVKMDSPKVVDTVDIEDIGSKGVFCRCWKSNKFPYCDGSHVKHNAETGDNTGPLIIKKSE